MDTLKIMKAGGQTVFERGMSEERGPFLILEADGALTLSTASSSGAKVLAALVRDEDGWVLASPDPSVPVRSGTKSDGSLPLVPGSSCSVGDYIFMLDSDVSVSGDVLLWRIDRSPIAAEVVRAGRNVIAEDSLRDGVMTVNPAVPGSELFEFYPTIDGLDVVMPSGGRMSVARRLCFSVGGFEGVVLPSAEAVAAIKTPRPFAYPSRNVRRRLLAAAFGVLLLFGAAGFLFNCAKSVERRADEPHGVTRIPGHPIGDIKVYASDDYVFLLSLYRDLPVVLGPHPTSVARDLISRAVGLSDTQMVSQATCFLKSVLSIQEAIRTEQWSDLSNQLDRVDRKLYVLANGLPFLKDAREVSDFVNLTVPASGLKIRNASQSERLTIEAGITNAVSELSDNRFIASRSLASFCTRLSRQYEVLNAYFAVSDRIGTHSDSLTPSEVDELYSAYLEVLRQGDRDIPGLLDNIQNDLRAFAARWFTALTDEFERTNVFRPELSAVGTLYDLAAETGTDEAVLKEWKSRRQAVLRQSANRAREAYEKYRMLHYGKSDAAMSLLDEIIGVGPNGGRFYTWAMEEKRHLTEEEKK